MGRHERRSDIARFRREASRTLLTYLVDVDDPLDARSAAATLAHAQWCLPIILAGPGADPSAGIKP